jgi:hypothetical protein
VRVADLGPAAGVAAKRPVACGVVSGGNRTELERRVVRAAEAALAERKFVTAIDVLVGVGWLQPARVDEWRQGRVDYLERAVIASLGKISTAMRCFRAWARARGLKPSETAHVARTRDRRPLRFSKTGDPEIERAYRTHWVSPELSARKRARLAERQGRPPQLVVISPVNDFTCSACGSLSEGPLMMETPGPVCLGCADMDHLVLLASDDAALTRRAKANSRLSAVVVRFSRARKRYERQGILVEEAALDRAEAECLADEEARARRRERDAIRRGDQDLEPQARMAAEIARLFPGCPVERGAIRCQVLDAHVEPTARVHTCDPCGPELAPDQQALPRHTSDVRADRRRCRPAPRDLPGRRRRTDARNLRSSDCGAGTQGWRSTRN